MKEEKERRSTKKEIDVFNNELPYLKISKTVMNAGFVSSHYELESKGYNIVEASMGMDYLVKKVKRLDNNKNILKKLGEKKSYIIEKALTVYFDLLDLKIAKKRMKDLEEGRDELVDAEEVWKELDI